MYKQVIAGLGEIGMPIFTIISKQVPSIGFDINPKLIGAKTTAKHAHLPTNLLHICIPFTTKFISNVISLTEQFKPQGIVIHSTISPGTTSAIQSKLQIPVIYSATRGVHKRMLFDLKRYIKFYSVDPHTPKADWVSKTYSKLMKKCGIKTKKMTSPITLELAKIVVDTSYYGWLINYAQLSNMIAIQHNVDYDEMWSFADEIQKFLGNRPKLFPGFIGGHCVIPNLDLMKNDTLEIIREINNDYSKILKKRQSLGKRY